MSLVCCGIKYSKSNPETYWCIDTDINKPIQKKYVENKRVIKEVVESYTCKKCGALIVKILRYAHERGKKKLIEQEKLNGIDAVEYLQQTEKIRQRQPQTEPMELIQNCKTIPFVYGKFIDAETQRPRYINEMDWASKDKYKTKIKISYEK